MILIFHCNKYYLIFSNTTHKHTLLQKHWHARLCLYQSLALFSNKVNTKILFLQVKLNHSLEKYLTTRAYKKQYNIEKGRRKEQPIINLHQFL